MVGNVIVELVDFVDRAVVSVLHIEAEVGGGSGDGRFARTFDFHESGEPGPGVDVNFDVAEFPFLAISFLIRFGLEAASFDKGDGFVVIVDGEADFFGAGESELFDVFVTHSNAITFVADAEEGAIVEVKNDAFHECLGEVESGTDALELSAESGFINIYKSGFDFWFHGYIIA